MSDPPAPVMYAINSDELSVGEFDASKVGLFAPAQSECRLAGCTFGSAGTAVVCSPRRSTRSEVSNPAFEPVQRVASAILSSLVLAVALTPRSSLEQAIGFSTGKHARRRRDRGLARTPRFTLPSCESSLAVVSGSLHQETELTMSLFLLLFASHACHRTAETNCAAVDTFARGT